MKVFTWPSLVAFALACFALGSSRVQAGGLILVTYGDTISNMGTLPAPEHGRDGESYDKLGYKYSYFGVLWLDLWTWGGTWCVYDGNHYVRLTRDEAAEEMGKPLSEMVPPRGFRYPPGWFVAGALVVLLGVSAFAQNKANAPTKKSVTPRPMPSTAASPTHARRPTPVASAPQTSGRAKSVDARAAEIYRQTLGTGDVSQERADAAFEAGVAHLVTNGVDRASAIDRLLAQIQAGVSA